MSNTAIVGWIMFLIGQFGVYGYFVVGHPSIINRANTPWWIADFLPNLESEFGIYFASQAWCRCIGQSRKQAATFESQNAMSATAAVGEQGLIARQPPARGSSVTVRATNTGPPHVLVLSPRSRRCPSTDYSCFNGFGADIAPFVDHGAPRPHPALVGRDRLDWETAQASAALSETSGDLVLVGGEGCQDFVLLALWSGG